MAIDRSQALRAVSLVQELKLLTPAEAAEMRRSFEPKYPLAAAVELAESFHLHIKVEDTAMLPRDRFLALGASVANEKPGYVKLAFAGGANVIFSSIPVSEDELRETPETRRIRPFLDHVGLDLRQETAEVRAAFDAVPERAGALGWGHAAQGGEGRPVFCCHTQVKGKHWVYPAGASSDLEAPIELAFGALVVEAGKSGCDLRPSDPRHGLASATCHASV